MSQLGRGVGLNQSDIQCRIVIPVAVADLPEYLVICHVELASTNRDSKSSTAVPVSSSPPLNTKTGFCILPCTSKSNNPPWKLIAPTISDDVALVSANEYDKTPVPPL